jgi:adenosylcobinamide-GDP ribazoletransferase
MKKLLLAFQFLTIIPIKGSGEVSDQEMGSATVFFPLVGMVEGILLFVSAFLLLKILPAEVANMLLVLVLVIINGGLHLDGLSDSFDALAARGNNDRKLSIMNDSSAGPAGVISIVFALLLIYVFLNAVHFLAQGTLYFAILVLLPVAARWSLVPSAYYGKPARRDGLGRLFIEHTGTREFLIATFSTFLIVFIICIAFSNVDLFVFFCMLIFPVLYAASLLGVWFFRGHFGGLTGDSFGAVNEISKLIFLISITIWLQKFI